MAQTGFSTALDQLAALLQNSAPFTVLTGAGCSTASGIPDYRDRKGDWKQKPPVQFKDFLGSGEARKRYWTRSLVGWPRFAAARPNAIHHHLVDMETAGWVNAVITQNVDVLHRSAGQATLVELHGRLDRLICLACGMQTSRHTFQSRLESTNRLLCDTLADRPIALAADGDVQYEPDSQAYCDVPACTDCNGILKPDVVFFGEVVPRERVETCYELLDASGGLLVLGSSLMVYSGYRFVRHATARGLPVVIVNQGVTRGDEDAVLKIDADCADTLSRLTKILNQSRGRARHP